MWFASSEGLNRFDGKNCYVYHHLNSDSNSLSSDNINAIFEDSKQRLWIATRNGLNLYDRLNDNFTRFFHDTANKNSISSNEVWSLAEDKQGGLWIGTMGGGLNKLTEIKNGKEDKTGYRFTNFKNNPLQAGSLSDNMVWTIAFDNLGQGWIGTYNGLNCFLVKDAEDNNISFIHYFKNGESTSISDNNVWRVWADNDNMIWVLSFNQMLDCLPAKYTAEKKGTAGFIHVLPLLMNKLGIKDLNALSIIKDKQNTFWIGTDKHGLIRCSINTSTASQTATPEPTEYFTHNDKNNQTLINNAVYALYEDETGLIWIGTQNGVSRYTPQKKFFDALHISNEELTDMPVKLIYPDKHYNWFASGNRLWLYSPGNKKTRLVCSLENAVEINCLYKTPAGDLLIGTTANGVYAIKANSIGDFTAGKIQYADADKLRLPEDSYLEQTSIFSFTEKNNNEVVVGGYGITGLYNFITNRFRAFRYPQQLNNATPNFRCITPAGKYYYAGTDNGLFLFDKVSNQYIAFQPSEGRLSADRINSLLFKGNKLWIATINGLNAYDINTGSIRNYFTEDGLPDNNIISLAEDKAGKLWIATRNGLCNFNSADSTFAAFYEQEGLNNNQINAVSFNDGILFIASDKGVNTVIPSALNDLKNKLNIVISDFKIAGKSLFTYPLTEKGKALKQQQPVKVNWNENNISIQFTALEYINPGAVKYAFILNGFDEDWIYNGNSNTANYTNLPGGDYIFKIKYAGSDGIWRESNIAIPVHVFTAWFRAWWFYLLCTVSATALVYAFYRIRLNRILEMQKVRNKIARDLHDDIGSTLSSIRILSGAAEKKINTDIIQAEKMLKKITESSGKMMDAMSDIVWSINPDNDKLDSMAVRMREYAAKALEPKNIMYKVTADDRASLIKLPAEKRRDVYLIFKEAVNNIAKYANATEAAITLNIHSNSLELTIKDNGDGFDTSITYTGNGLKNMQQRTKNLNGGYNVISKAGEGTIIHLTVPVT